MRQSVEIVSGGYDPALVGYYATIIDTEEIDDDWDHYVLFNIYDPDGNKLSGKAPHAVRTSKRDYAEAYDAVRKIVVFAAKGDMMTNRKFVRI